MWASRITQLHSFGKIAELMNAKAGDTNSSHNIFISKKKAELRADSLTHKLYCNRQMCKENAFKMKRLQQSILFRSQTKAPCNGLAHFPTFWRNCLSPSSEKDIDSYVLWNAGKVAHCNMVLFSKKRKETSWNTEDFCYLRHLNLDLQGTRN